MGIGTAAGAVGPSQPAMDVETASKEVIAKHPDIKVVQEQTANYQRNQAIDLMNNWITNGVRFDAVAANNDEMAIGAMDAQMASIWVRQRRYDRFVLTRSLPAFLSSSWGRSKMTIREMSLGGGMGTKDDNQRIGSEASVEISVGMRKITAQVLLRRARVNELGFEIVNIDLESRYRLRRVLMEAAQHATQFKSDEWDGQRKP
jgi:hypothetical protein